MGKVTALFVLLAASAAFAGPVYSVDGGWTDWYVLPTTVSTVWTSAGSHVSTSSSGTGAARGNSIDGGYVTYTTVATANTDKILYTNTTTTAVWVAEQVPRLDMLAEKLDSAAMRWCLGIATYSATLCDSDEPTAYGTWIRYSTTASNTNWWCCAAKSGTAVCTDSGKAADTNGHLFSVRYSAPGSAKAYLDNAELCTFNAATTPDDASTLLHYLMAVYTTEAVAKSARVWGFQVWGM